MKTLATCFHIALILEAGRVLTVRNLSAAESVWWMMLAGLLIGIGIGLRAPASGRVLRETAGGSALDLLFLLLMGGGTLVSELVSTLPLGLLSLAGAMAFMSLLDEADPGSTADLLGLFAPLSQMLAVGIVLFGEAYAGGLALWMLPGVGLALVMTLDAPAGVENPS